MKLPSGLLPVTLTLNGVKVNKNIPTSWEYVTFRQFLDLVGKETDEEIISVLLGIDLETVKKARFTNLSMIKAMIQFTRGKLEYELPKSILGYTIRPNIEIEEIQRYADLESILKGFGEDGKENMKQFPLMVTTYIVEPYNFKDAENMAPAFLDAPALEVLAVANFIRTNIIVSKAITPVILQLAALQRRRSRLVMRSFIARLVFSVYWFFLKRRFPNPVRSYLSGQLKSLNLTFGT